MSRQLVLKSQNAVSDFSTLPDVQYYVDRVIAEGGTIGNTVELHEAFTFIFQNSISADKVVSATNPAWGIKKNAEGVVLKLYSLFDPAGDIVFNTSGSIKPRFNETHNFTSVYFGGSSSCYGKLAGIFDIEDSLATVTVNAIPVGVPYGTQLAMPVSLVWSEKEFRDASASSPSNYLALSRSILRPTTTNTNPAEWFNSIAVSTSSAGSLASAVNQPAKPIAAYMSLSTGLDILNDFGSVAHSALPANNADRTKNLTFQLGVSLDGTGNLSGNIVSHFFENWVLRDVSINETVLFTQRVNEKYYNKL